MEITASQVKELREMTGVGMMECKKALIENSGNLDKAILWLRERGMARAAQKADRAAAEGLVQVLVSENKKEGLLLEVNCETDFAAKNEDFRQFVAEVGALALQEKIKTIDALKSAKFRGVTVAEALTALIAKVGENMNVRRVVYLDQPNGLVVGYSHMGGRIGTLVAIENVTLSSESEELGKDIAMHVAAAAPRYLDRSLVNQTELEEEKSIARKKLKEQGKTDDIIEKAMDGQVVRFYKEVCLVDQPFIKEPKMTVDAVVNQRAKGARIHQFQRFQLGEGIEVKVTNFADEVAQQLKK